MTETQPQNETHLCLFGPVVLIIWSHVISKLEIANVRPASNAAITTIVNATARNPRNGALSSSKRYLR